MHITVSFRGAVTCVAISMLDFSTYKVLQI